MTDEAELRIGQRLGHYVLKEIIGRGGMGVVYRGEHAYIHKRVAVKVLHSRYFGNPHAKERFLREARAASAINHPNIVGVTDFGEAPDGTVFLVMDHLDGQPLDRVLRKERTVDLFRCIVILSQVTKAVGEAHRKGIVHRDLKPENIMLERRPERREVVRQVTDQRGTLEIIDTINEYDFVTVLDFGAAKIWEQDAGPTDTGAGTVIATPAYMAPETARIGVADARSDIYSVGVIFYQMLTGTLPFSGENAADVMMKHVVEPVQPPSQRNPHVEVSPDAEHTIMRALSKHPEDRHRTMDDLYVDLQRSFGSMRFRRVDHDGASAVTLRKPIPLTREKRATGKPHTPMPPAPAPITPIAPVAAPVPKTPPPVAFRTPGPVPTTPATAASSSPIPLTRKKTTSQPDRKRTLPFGVGTPEPVVTGEPPRENTQPYPAQGPDSATRPPKG